MLSLTIAMMFACFATSNDPLAEAEDLVRAAGPRLIPLPAARKLVSEPERPLERWSVLMYQEGRLAVGPFSHYKSLAEATDSARKMVAPEDRRLGIYTEVRDGSGKVVARFNDGQGGR